MNHVVTAEMFDAFLSIKNKYVHDEESFRQFYFYMSDFNQMVRIDALWSYQRALKLS